MLRIRFPDGQCIQYNDVVCVEWQQNGAAHLLTKKDERGTRYVHAIVAPGTNAVLEYVRPCAISNPVADASPEKAVAIVKQHLRTLPTQLVKELKLALRPFNAKRHTWSA